MYGKLKKPRFPFNLQRNQNFRFEFQAASSGEWNSISEILKREQSREEFSLGIPKFSSIFFPEFNSSGLQAGSLDPSEPVFPSSIAR